jgi:hypothetical protein
MKFEATSRIFGDCTQNFKVTDFPGTVEELVDQILARTNEWGSIRIDMGEGIGFFELEEYEYKYGILIDQIPNEKLAAKVKSVTANGGWTYMSYLIITEGGEE